jgi:hypothetical protein
MDMGGASILFVVCDVSGAAFDALAPLCFAFAFGFAAAFGDRFPFPFDFPFLRVAGTSS